MKLLSIKNVPPWLQFNRFVLTGYRPQMSAYEAFWSVFSIHNETVNIWSHLVPALLLIVFQWYSPVRSFPIAVTSGRGATMTMDSDNNDNIDMYFPGAVDQSPFFVENTLLFSLCVASITIIFTASAVYHALMPCCRSHDGYRRLICVDVVGSLICITTTAYSFILMGNKCFDAVWNIVIAIGFCGYSVALLYVILFSQMNVTHRFALFGTQCLLRIMIMLIIVGPKALQYGHVNSFYYHTMSFVTLLAGGIFNITRIPEKWFPNVRFLDFILNSHNIWHYFAVQSCSMTLLGCYYDQVEYHATTCVFK